MISKTDSAESNAMRVVRANISKRKWQAAYRAVDELLFIRARKVDGFAPYVTTPCIVSHLMFFKGAPIVMAEHCHG